MLNRRTGGADGGKHGEICPWCHTRMGPAPQAVECSFCGQTGTDGLDCRNGHRVCGDCRGLDPGQIIERLCLLSTDTDPMALCVRLLHHPALRPMGEGHHLLLAPVLLAAIRNSGQEDMNPCWLSAAMNRLDDVPTGACAFRGQCGALLGVGAVVSVLTGATAAMPKERALALRATAEAMLDLAKIGGEHCCKMSVFSGLRTAVVFLAERLDIQLTARSMICPFAGDPSCHGDVCPFHPLSAGSATPPPAPGGGGTEPPERGPEMQNQRFGGHSCPPPGRA